MAGCYNHLDQQNESHARQASF